MQKKIKKPVSELIIQIVAIIVCGIAALLCLLPFLLVISGSLTDNDYILQYGYNILPGKFSLEAYQFIFEIPGPVLQAYGVTLLNTTVGTSIGLFIIAMTGYVLQRPDCKYRNRISFFIYFTTLFQGGLIAWYIMITRYYQLQDNRLVLILPLLMNPFLIILMKNFIKTSVPHDIIEAAIIDGANDFTIFTQIVLKLATPGLATIGLFLALAYWNDWFHSSLFISTPSKYSLQFFLYNTLNNTQAMRELSQTGASVSMEVPTESVRLAMAVICTGPIVLLYPFVQRYFVKGLTIGAVKG
ncbi:carbohydrate ABC transporter permease [Spirochaeta cellobiosiphila]|uniref:carbohydrate ABC transporter permease n=1 Tax=Spirochaeta cellobiosiphila TaxID=504483 RepID=UPI00040E7369|nr:carbohydrate ABC transporter permease [Spirochaeta cellobiosiphila]